MGTVHCLMLCWDKALALLSPLARGEDMVGHAAIASYSTTENKTKPLLASWRKVPIYVDA